MWANVINLDSEMTPEMVRIEEKRESLVREMIPKDSYGK